MKTELYADTVFAPDHKGRRVSAKSILARKTNTKADREERWQLYLNLEFLAMHYYNGNTDVVDEFLQRYCLAEKFRITAKKKDKQLFEAQAQAIHDLRMENSGQAALIERLKKEVQP
jgi:hypothetical protein